MSSLDDLSLQHLEAELTRIDLMLHRAIRRWRMAGQDPNDAFRGLYVTDAEIDALLRRPLSTSWGHAASLRPGDEGSYTRAISKVESHIASLLTASHQQGHALRLEHLANVFHLRRLELDALLICLAAALDLRYERIYGYLQDDVTRKRPGLNLVLDLLCLPGLDRLKNLSAFTDAAPLFHFHLLERVQDPAAVSASQLNQMFAVDASVVAWLLGRYQPHVDLGAHARLLAPRWNERDQLLGARALPQLEGLAGAPALVVFHGPDAASQQAAARLLAARAQRALLTVDLAAVARGEISALAAVRLALRDARMTAAIPCLDGWDVCLVDRAPAAEVMAEVCAYPDQVILAGRTAWQVRGVERDRSLLWMEFPAPDYSQRRALWLHFIGVDETKAEALQVSDVAGQFLLTTAQISDAAATARDVAAQRGGDLLGQDLFAAARLHSSTGLAGLARKIPSRYTWHDIILPHDQIAILREIVATVRGRPIVLDEWGVGQKLVSSNGVTVLFAGPPGTGKTMAAEVVANELGLDLYKIDLSTVVSKYIGETEKNLERVFNEAESSNAILFFDEADAIFGKRSEVRDSHDRYANIEISYLLQRMEAYNGVTILATNLRANLDEAFTRRLQFAVDFPFPEEADRLRMWQTLFPPDVPRDADLDLKLLSRKFKLAGGNIRNIIVNAAYLAAANGGRVTMEQLLHGTRRELQKMGRLVRDLGLDSDRTAS